MRSRSACCRMAAGAGAAFCGACGAPTGGGRRLPMAAHADLLGAAAIFVAVVAAAAGLSSLTPAVSAPAGAVGPLGGSESWGGWVSSVFGEAPEGAIIDDVGDDTASTRAEISEPSAAEEGEAPTAGEAAAAVAPPGAGVTLPAAPAPRPSRRLSPVSATASSYSGAARGGSSYHPSNAIDGDRSTGWQVSHGGVGEWIRLDFGRAVLLDRVGVLPGYDKFLPDRFGDRWPLNNRVAEAHIEWDGGVLTQRYEDLRDLQLTEMSGVRTRHVTIRVMGVRPGSRWRDTVISEIECFGRLP